MSTRLTHRARLLDVLNNNLSGLKRAQALNSAFTWMATKQGTIYWSRVSDALRAGNGLTSEDAVFLLAMYDQNTAQPTIEPYKKESQPMSTLFFHKLSNMYGKYLTIDSQDRVVLEMKSGDIKAFKRDEVEEVTPYTVEISGTHYRTKEGAVNVGDIVILGTGAPVMFRVNAVGTKFKGAAHVLKGIVITGTPIAAPDEG